MSVRAYIVRKKMIWVNEDAGFFKYDNNGENLTKYVHENLEYAINVWHQDKLIERILDFGGIDYTNEDFVGDVEISKDNFESMIEYTKELYTVEDFESIKKIQKYFNEGNDWLTLKCC